MKNNKEIYTFKMIKLDDILKTGDMNIRKVDDLADLKASIKEHGIINPVTVTKIADGYRLLAGFRRCWAAAQLGMEKVPCHVYEADEKLLKEIPVTENVCRLNMSPAEECLAVAHLVNNKNTPKTVARKFGKSLRWVLIRKKIADAGESAIAKLESGDLELAAAAKLADLPDEEFKKVIEENLSITSSNVDDILEEFHLDLEKAPFDHSKCLKCEKCSACQLDLFQDEPKAYCLDPACYQKKVKEAAEKKAKELEAEGRTVKLGKFQSWGLDSDDEDYNHEIRSYMSKYKEAEEAGIQKRILVDPDTCQVLEYYDERDLPGYIEETQEEIDARHEEENRERKMNGIRCNMYKDKLQAAIEKVCKVNIDWLLVLAIINSDDVEEVFSEEFVKELGLWCEESDGGYRKSFWNGDNDFEAMAKTPLSKLLEGIKGGIKFLFDNLYYSTERMEFTYKLIVGKDPSKLKPSEKAVQEEYERQEAGEEG
jgi:ParB/RepB/Spo0J family partition protein